MQNSTGIYLYVLALTGVIAVVLASLYNSLDPLYKANKDTAKKKAILSCIPDQKGVTDVQAVFNSSVTTLIIDAEGKLVSNVETTTKDVNAAEYKADLEKLNKRGRGVKYSKLSDVDLASEEKFAAENRVYPLYKFESAEKKTYYVVAVRGNGLWDKIWGYIALQNQEGVWKIVGVNFDHKGETPGLGAEIKDSEDFKDAFKDKRIYNEEGEYVSVTVLKKNIKNPESQIQAISGATVTSDGVSEMMVRGIRYYLPYLEAEAQKAISSK